MEFVVNLECHNKIENSNRYHNFQFYASVVMVVVVDRVTHEHKHGRYLVAFRGVNLINFVINNNEIHI